MDYFAYNSRHRRSDDDGQVSEDAGNSAGKAIKVDEADKLSEPGAVTVDEARRHIREMRDKLQKENCR